MKSKIDLLISVAGWEERFELGIENDLARLTIDKIMLFVFDEYKEQTSDKRMMLAAKAKELGVLYQEVQVVRDPKSLWTAIQRAISVDLSGKSILVNLTTMPREVLWWTLLRLQAFQSRIYFVYYKPSSYSRDLLTWDTGKPRLLYQLSGIADLGKPTCLLLLTGFDADRAVQMIEYFEPEKVVLGIQAGEQFENQSRNIEQNSVLRKRAPGLESFVLDATSSDYGFSAIEVALRGLQSKYNLICASLGPKISAVALYKLQRKYPAIALAYAPSRRFNQHYSNGIGDLLEGELEV